MTNTPPPPNIALHNPAIEPEYEQPHNAGQPLHRQEDDRGLQRSKLATDCSVQQRASLECIDVHYEQKDVCQPFFEAYKHCRFKERKKRLAENAKKGGDTDAAGCAVS
eukprot:CAMPEP_0198249082 /NCGR_PEP_ID=MMETSP1447-20131203/702_1 /TAXON_ID=420782 /ORGANISM="Chaetoceros dichaeta, Strain CCMP1751" /LENGTH=107 /DNA_ID=CAMNT_0043933627 /DNA_START=88 /DNA_END=411 /DNA_ORIENTATION=+